MTIGIILKFKERDTEGLVLIADRMYTYQEIIGVETDISKIEAVYAENCNAVYGIGSGSGPLITAYFNSLRSRVSSDPSRLLDHLVGSYNDVIVQKIKNSVLGPLGAEFNPADIERYTNNPTIFNMINNKVNEVWNNLDVLIGIVRGNRVSIHNINSSEDIDLTTQGFGVTGSGANSALWTLIHLGYSPNSDMRTALTLGLFAKFQSEESHGVGEATDAIVVYCGGDSLVVNTVDGSTIARIKEIYKEMIRLQNQKVDEAKKCINL